MNDRLLKDLVNGVNGIERELSKINENLQDIAALDTVSNALRGIDHTLYESLTSHKVGTALDAIGRIADMMEEATEDHD